MKKKRKNKENARKYKKTIFSIKVTLITILILLLIPIAILASREILVKDIDDLSTGMDCDPTYLDKADVVWMIPLFQNETPSEEWCRDLRELDKTKVIGMHGIFHTHHEFSKNVSEEDLLRGMEVFKDCTGYYPEKFKPPHLEISWDNYKLVSEYMDVHWYDYQIFHKVYHCENYPQISNELMDWF